MIPSSLFLFLTFTICGLAYGHRYDARATVSLIPSATSTQPIATTSPTGQTDQRPHSKHVNDFYKLYGWLKPGTNVPDADLPKAIRKIQRVLKEPVTGVFSDKMMNIMTKPRCGTEQPYNETDANASPVHLHKRYVLWGPKWAKTTLTWRFLNYSSDVSQTVQQSTIRSAKNLIVTFTLVHPPT